MSVDVKKQRKNGPDAIVFCKEWNAATNLDDFCAATGMDKLTASQRATTYRKAGVNLKFFERGGRKKLDVAALNAMLGAAIETPSESEPTAETVGETVAE